MDPFSIAGGLAGLLSLFKKGKDEDPFKSPELQRLLKLQMDRMYGQNPMFESVAKLAFSRMPTATREGLAAPSLSEGLANTPGGYDEESSLPPELRAILRNQEVRFRMTDPLYQAIQRLVGGRMPMGMKPVSNQWGYDPYGTPNPKPPGDWNTDGGGGGGGGDNAPPGDDVPEWPSFSNAPAKDPWMPNYKKY